MLEKVKSSEKKAANFGVQFIKLKPGRVLLVGDSFVSTVKLDNDNDSDDKKKHPSSKVTRSVSWMKESFISKCFPGRWDRL